MTIITIFIVGVTMDTATCPEETLELRPSVDWRVVPTRK